MFAVNIWRYEGSQKSTFLHSMHSFRESTFSNVSEFQNLRYEAAFDAYTQLGNAWYTGLATTLF